MITALIRFSFVIAMVPLLLSCATPRKFTPADPHWHELDNEDIEKPKTRKSKLVQTSIDRTFFDQTEQIFNIERDYRIIVDDREQALNINSYDEVPNSSWFVNRHGLLDMTPAAIAAGYSRTAGPDTSGPWTVFRPKVGGATPGFWIEDARGDQYIIKFDPPENPELATGAAAMASRYLHACGYNVPQETIVYWRPELLRIKEGVTFKNSKGEKRPFSREKLDEIMKDVRLNADGNIRSLASLALPNVIGPFKFDGRRKDDPNDWCYHNFRRELRGLYVIASLINHYDTKDQNTLTTYEEENGNRFVKHYLIDFGSTFGADGDDPKPPKKGYANLFDLRDAVVSLFTLGLKTWKWQDHKPYQYASIGYFESEIFEPNKWDPILPNPAFEDMTKRDAYWGAKIVMAFRDDDLTALVGEGQYSDPEAANYLLQTLIERRDKIGRYWFGKVNPIDKIAFINANGEVDIDFEDLAVLYGLEEANAARYRYMVKYGNKTVIDYVSLNGTSLRLVADQLAKLSSAYPSGKADVKDDDHLFELQIQTSRNNGRWSKPTSLWMWYHPDQSRYQLVGIVHND